MRIIANKAEFGIKGREEQAMSYGEMLLSGQPMQRQYAKAVQKLKPRPKAVFGHKAVKNTCHIQKQGRWFFGFLSWH